MGNNREWGVGALPDACRHCGTTTLKHRGRGLCVECFLTQKENYPTLPRGRHVAKDGDRDMVDDQTSPENVVPELPAEPVDAALGSGGLGEDAGEVAPETRERRPGGASPSPPADAPGAPTKPKGRFARFFGGKDDSTGEPGVNTERPPKVPKVRSTSKRISGAETIGDAWAGFGSLCLRNPGYVPLGRYMQFQAPVAGEMLDEAVTGTVVDKLVVQPIVKARGRFDLIAAVFGPPGLIVAIQRNPERAEMLLPLLKSSIRNALPLMVPAIKKVTAKEAATVKAADDLFADDEGYRAYVAHVEGMGTKPDPADYILSMLFVGTMYDPANQTVPAPEEAPVP